MSRTTQILHLRHESQSAQKITKSHRAAANRSETTSMLPVVQAADTSAAARRLNQASVTERLQRNHWGGVRRRTETQYIDFRAVKFWYFCIFVCFWGDSENMIGWYLHVEEKQ